MDAAQSLANENRLTEDAVLGAVHHALAHAAHDLPFSLLYLFDEAGNEYACAGANHADELVESIPWFDRAAQADAHEAAFGRGVAFVVLHPTLAPVVA